MDVWTQARLQKFIDDQVQEHLQLDYKEAAALDKRNQKRIEDITKDVSAFANSAGGMIIYGIKEAQNIPVSLDPVDLNQATRETLDQIIGTIQPKIEGVVIYPVTINNDSTKQIFVVQVPQSTTAHQAKDRKYYKRLNTTSEAMLDYEIRDVMGRHQQPRIDLTFDISIEYLNSRLPLHRLYITANNRGKILARFLRIELLIPVYILNSRNVENKFATLDSSEYFVVTGDNRQEVTRTKIDSLHLGAPVVPTTNSFIPILPSTSITIMQLLLIPNLKIDDFASENIYWTSYADNAAPTSGIVRLGDIEREIVV